LAGRIEEMKTSFLDFSNSNWILGSEDFPPAEAVWPHVVQAA
jgi:hypothetical protein